MKPQQPEIDKSSGYLPKVVFLLQNSLRFPSFGFHRQCFLAELCWKVMFMRVCCENKAIHKCQDATYLTCLIVHSFSNRAAVTASSCHVQQQYETNLCKHGPQQMYHNVIVLQSFDMVEQESNVLRVTSESQQSQMRRSTAVWSVRFEDSVLNIRSFMYQTPLASVERRKDHWELSVHMACEC